MDASTVKRRFLRVNRLFGLMTGVWPYQAARTKLLERTVSICLLTSCLVTQVAHSVIHFNVDAFVTSAPYINAVIGAFLKLSNYVIQESKLMSLLESIFEDWSVVKSVDEYDIMEQYSRRGEFVALLYLLHIMTAIVSFVCLPFVPPVMDLVVPLNESRKRLFLYPAYYWLDCDKYYIYVAGHMICAVILIGCVFCACDMNYVYMVHHACGLLAVSKYRFEKACRRFSARNGEMAVKSPGDMYKDVCHSIRGHQRAIKYIKQIENSHNIYLFLSMGLLILNVSMSLLRIASDEPQAQWFQNCMYTAAELLHVFFLNVQGQFLVNSCDDLYNAIYDSLWYNSTPEARALHVLALRSCLTSPLLTAGGLITINMKSFAEIIKTSLSYYTVMKST